MEGQDPSQPPQGGGVGPTQPPQRGKTPPNLPKGEESQVAGSVGAEQRFRTHQRIGGSVGGDASKRRNSA